MIACKRNTKWSSPSIFWCPAINFAIETAMRLSEQLWWEDPALTDSEDDEAKLSITKLTQYALGWQIYP